MNNVIGWVVFGLIAGVAANLIDQRPVSGGIVGAIVLGITGALVGGFLSTLMFGTGITGYNLPSFLIAIMGAVLLLFLGRALTRV